jgi:hypothetical protein
MVHHTRKTVVSTQLCPDHIDPCLSAETTTRFQQFLARRIAANVAKLREFGGEAALTF